MSKKDKLSFTGHDTFHCRTYWLKKGYDFIENDGQFNDKAVVELGVGRNMVSSIRYWLRCFGITDDQDKLQTIAHAIFSTTDGFDAYCEDKKTVWLLHYLLVTNHRASIYTIIFNHFRKNHIEFNKKQLIDYLTNYCKIHDYTVHNSSLERDVDVFLHNYFHKHSVKNSIEESMSGILQELNLVEYVGKSNAIDVYKIENQERTDLPTLVVLFGIIRQLKGNLSINFHELLNGLDSVGSVFAINANGLMVKIEEILSHFPQEITYKDDGGIRLLQFKKQFSEIEIIAKIYDNASELVALG